MKKFKISNYTMGGQALQLHRAAEESAFTIRTLNNYDESKSIPALLESTKKLLLKGYKMTSFSGDINKVMIFLQKTQGRGFIWFSRGEF